MDNPSGFNPQYPIINLAKGESDFENSTSGPSIDARLNRAGMQGYTVRNLTQKAKEGDTQAILLIKEIGREVGQAHAALFAAYADEEFIKHWVLISGVNENLGKGVYEKGQAEDIYISSVREGLIEELVSYFGMEQAKAEEIAKGIARSNMTYERELISYQPTNEDMQNSSDTRLAAAFLPESPMLEAKERIEEINGFLNKESHYSLGNSSLEETMFKSRASKIENLGGEMNEAMQAQQMLMQAI